MEGVVKVILLVIYVKKIVRRRKKWTEKMATNVFCVALKEVWY